MQNIPWIEPVRITIVRSKRSPSKKQILSMHYGTMDQNEVAESYRRRYALSKLSITSPEIMKRFKGLNKGKPPRGRMKRFNFVMIGTSIEPRKHTLKAIKPTIPFSKDYHMAP